MSEIADRILEIAAAGTVNTIVFLMDLCCATFSVVSLEDTISQFAHVNFSLIEKSSSRAREFFSRLERFETR